MILYYEIYSNLPNINEGSRPFYSYTLVDFPRTEWPCRLELHFANIIYSTSDFQHFTEHQANERMDLPAIDTQPSHGWRKALAFMRQWLEASEQQTVTCEWFSEREIAGYDRALPNSNEPLNPSRVDDATWRDLDVRSYLQCIGSSASIFARQMLYHRLRSGADSTEFAAPLMEAVAGERMETAQVLAATRSTRHRLRCIDVDITPTLFHGERIALPGWTRHIGDAAWLALVGLLLATSPSLGLSALAAWLVGTYVVFNAWTQIKLYRTLMRWNTQRDGVLAMLQAARALGQSGQTTQHAALRPLTEQLPEIERLLRALSPNWIDRTPMLAEYANLFALYQYGQLAARTCGLQAQLQALQTVYVQLANCEAQLCLLEHVQTLPVVCRAEFAAMSNLPNLEVHGMVNPLLDRPQALTLALQGKGAFVSGQNGVGKSTLLRGLGLNLLAARSFGFCYAASATVPRLAVWSSIQNEDSLATADSLYMAEMRRAETLLHVAEHPNGAVFLIDEIFRGTNNAESVAAAAAVLSHLAARALVVVSSHNVVLAPLLQPWLEPLRLVQDPAGGNAALTLEPGVLAHTNGLQMMQNYQFPAGVYATAGQVHAWFASYVAQPDHFPDLTTTG